MYIYKVTHIPTSKFYIGLSTQPKSTFDGTRDLDPYNEFEVYGSNGTRLKMVNVEKRILAVAGDTNELAQLGADLAKSSESDPNFIGLKGQPTHNITVTSSPKNISTTVIP